MGDDLIDYYREQAGNGISGYKGIKYQRGHGFFGRFLDKAIYPMLRFMGKKALNTGVNVAPDLITDKKNWKVSAKNRFKETTGDILEAGLNRARKFQQTGEGRKRKRRRRSRKKKHSLLNKTIKRQRKSKKKRVVKRRRKRKNYNSLF